MLNYKDYMRVVKKDELIYTALSAVGFFFHVDNKRQTYCVRRPLRRFHRTRCSVRFVRAQLNNH